MVRNAHISISNYFVFTPPIVRARILEKCCGVEWSKQNLARSRVEFAVRANCPALPPPSPQAGPGGAWRGVAGWDGGRPAGLEPHIQSVCPQDKYLRGVIQRKRLATDLIAGLDAGEQGRQGWQGRTSAGRAAGWRGARRGGPARLFIGDSSGTVPGAHIPQSGREGKGRSRW